jgi:hypothetical protein
MRRAHDLAMAENRSEERHLYLISSMAAVLSIGTWVLFYRQGLLTVGGDMATHLNLARRVFDNLTPGVANLGAYWLPLLHVLELPLIWNDALWRSGLAGAIVSMICYVVATVFLFRLSDLLLRDRGSALVATLIFMTNPVLCFLQAAPMFESVLVTTALVSITYLADWVLKERLSSLMLCALASALAVLVRFDNWALSLTIAAAVFAVSMRRSRDSSEIEANLLAYLSPPAYSLFLFVFLLNWMLLGDPLYFLHPSFHRTVVGGAGVVHASTDVLYAQYTRHQLLVSLLRFVLAAAHSSGFVIYALSILGLLVFVVRNRLSNRALVAYTLLTPYCFFWLMLFMRGHPPIMVPELPPYDAASPYWNVRYGITALPAVALFCGYVTAGSAWRKVLVLALLAIQLGLFIFGGAFYPSRTPEINASLALTPEEWATFEWLSSSYDEGLVLMSTYKAGDTASGDTVIIHSGLDNRQFIHEGTQHYWRESLIDPGRYADWIVVKKGDQLQNLVDASPQLFRDFRLVFESDTGKYRILQKEASRREAG